MRLMMRVVGRVLVVSAGMGMVMAAHVARAQGSCTFTDESGKTVTWPNCQPPADTKSPPPNGVIPPGTSPTTTPAQGTTPASGASPAKSFLFPGETPGASSGAQGAPTGQSAGGTAPAAGSGAQPAANPNQPANPHQGAASKFPFPGEDSSGGASKSGNGLKDAGSSGSSNSSRSSSSSSSGSGSAAGDDPTAGPLGDDPDPAAKAAEARRAARRKKGIDFHQTSDEREAEDVKIATYYQNDGDFKGAYERATDAVSLVDDDAEAHLALAEAARRLGKLDEAEKNYKKCLALDPVPKTKRAAEKALKEMAGG